MSDGSFRKIIMTRDDDDGPSLLKRFNAHGRGPVTDRLRALYDDAARGNPHRTSEANFADAWNSLSGAERDAVRAEEEMAAREKALEEAAQRNEGTMKNRADEIADMAKHGAFVVSKAMVDNGAPGLTEHEHYRVMQTDFQKNRLPNETPEQCFTRQFTTNTEEGRVIREAHQMTKPMTAPIGGGAAYNAIVAKGEQLRKADPKLTREQAFTAAYCDPENRRLVEMQKVEHRTR
jgi:hypothetical protein